MSAYSAPVPRRGLSGIFIFDRLPGETRRQPTCIEDCRPKTLLAWLCTLTPEGLDRTIILLDASIADVFEITNTVNIRNTIIPDIDTDDADKKILIASKLARMLRFIADEMDIVADREPETSE